MAPVDTESESGNACLDSKMELDDKSTKGHSKNKNEDYKRKRERNNIAVKKSRSKSKLKTQETLERVNQLKVENEMLESKVNILTKELSFLKDLFLAHAGNAHGQNLSPNELNTLLSEESAPGTWAEEHIKKEDDSNDDPHSS